MSGSDCVASPELFTAWSHRGIKFMLLACQCVSHLINMNSHIRDIDTCFREYKCNPMGMLLHHHWKAAMGFLMQSPLMGIESPRKPPWRF